MQPGEIDAEKMVAMNNIAVGYLNDKLDWHGFHKDGKPMFPATGQISSPCNLKEAGSREPGRRSP